MNNSSSLFYNVTNTVLKMGSELISNKTNMEQPSSTRDGGNNYLILGIASLLLLIGGGVGYRYFLFARKKPALKNSVDLDEAFSLCTEQMSKEEIDIEVINEALFSHRQEAIFFLEQKQKRYPAYVQPATEKTHLIDSKNQPDCNHGLNVLNELINTYPKYSFYDNPSVETLTSFATAREEHHAHVLSAANGVLPDLRTLLNEVRDRDKAALNLNLG